jgi:uncharacterized zinc-type alcohol dehydrogenase-like protein
MTVIGYGALAANQELQPVKFNREPLRAGEVAIDIAFCGVCHSDIHQCADDWENTVWPCVPGHEIVGVVTEIGEGVSKFGIGDMVGVGCMVNSCQVCEPCKTGDEQYCAGPKSATFTYNGPKLPDGTNSYGGYSDSIVVREEFVLSIPEIIEPAKAAPILCAGVTTYQPMKHFELKAGQTLGVAGIGGLGHMAVQIGKALGATVIAFTTSAEKVDAVKALGADKVVVMADAEAAKKAAQSLDMMIDTIPYPHDIADYLTFMKPNSTLVVVGNMMQFEAFNPGPMVFNRISVAGSLIGGIADTREVLDLCARHDIRPEIQMIDIADINSAFGRVKDEDVRFRHVIDMASLKAKRDEILRSAKQLDTPIRGEPVNRRASDFQKIEAMKENEKPSGTSASFTGTDHVGIPAATSQAQD